MERNFYNDDFERLIRQKADQYKMYPSDQVWKGIYKSLHGRKRWHWAGLAVLLLGIGTYTGNYYLSDEPAAKIAGNIQPSITAANQAQRSNTPASGNTTDAGRENAANTNSSATAVRNVTGNPSGANTDAVAGNSSFANNPDRQSSTNRNGLPGNTLVPFENRSNETSLIISNDPSNLNGSRNARTNIAEKHTTAANIQIPGAKESSAKLKEADKLSFADAASESVLDENKRQSVNWLEDYAMFQLTANKPKRLGVQIFFSPTVNYRRLSGSSYFPSSEVKSIPLSPNIMGDVDQYVKHKPALGFELGANLLYRSSKRVNFKAGLQFNYSRYNIQAYQTLPEVATIALSNSFAFQADTISNLSSIRNLSGYAQEDLSNQYFQLSMPVGIEFRVMGTDKLQLNVAGTIQPTYLLNRNSYLITTDYKNYMREPSLVRRWNVNGGLETYISYNTGTVRWQVGPQFRYQLLSSYSRKYPIKEQLMEYGIKIGVTKTIQ